MFVCRLYALYGFFLFFSQILNSYASEAEAWRHSNSNEVVYLLYDIHELPQSVRDEDRDINYEHREQIIHFARSTESSLVVEDPSNLTNKKLSFVELHGKFNGERTAMYCITPLASQESILSTSVEFRPGTVQHKSRVTTSELVDASKKLIKKIQGYRDGELLDGYYKKNCELHTYMLSKCEQLFQRIADLDKGITKEAYQEIICPKEALDVLREYYSDEYLSCFKPCDKIDLIVTYYNTYLLDAVLLHALSEHLKASEKSIVMFAGGGHLRRITPILTRMGYRLHEQYVEPYGSEKLFDIDRALKEIEPSYDPNKQLPKTAVDYFLVYKRWEAKHPTLKKFVPAYTIAVWLDYYKEWQQEESVVKKAAPMAITGTALVIICTLIRLYCGGKS